MKRFLKVLIIILSLITGLVIGFYINEKDIISFKQEKEESKKENAEEINTVIGKKYLLNYEGNEYFYFKYDNTYERKNLNKNTNKYETKTGNYTVDNNKITFDGVLKAEIRSDDSLLVYEESENYNENEFLYSIYYEEKNIISMFNSYTLSIEEYLNGLKKNDENLSNISYVKSDISRCFVKSNNLDNTICSINYRVYFPNEENYQKEICENDENKFKPYSISSGYCDYDSVYNWSFFEFDKNYNFVSSFTGL